MNSEVKYTFNFEILLCFRISWFLGKFYGGPVFKCNLPSIGEIDKIENMWFFTIYIWHNIQKSHKWRKHLIRFIFKKMIVSKYSKW